MLRAAAKGPMNASLPRAQDTLNPPLCISVISPCDCFGYVTSNATDVIDTPAFMISSSAAPATYPVDVTAC